MSDRAAVLALVIALLALVMPEPDELTAGGNVTLLKSGNEIIISANNSGGTTDHAALTNLNWANAGHTIDTDMDLGGQDIINNEYAYPRHVHINDNNAYTPNDVDSASNNYVFDVSLQNKSAVTNFKVYSNNTGLYPYFLGGKAGGNISHPASLNTINLFLFSVSAVGYKTNTWSTKAAGVDFFTEDAGWNNTNTPTVIGFGTTKNGSATLGYRWVINGSGVLYPNIDDTYEIGHATKRVGEIYAALPAADALYSAVCTDGTRLYNSGGGTCTVSSEKFKTNITNKTVDRSNVSKFQLIWYDQKITDTDIIENVTYEATGDPLQPVREVINTTVIKKDRLITRYGLKAEDVAKIDKKLVIYDRYGNITGVYYEDLAAYLFNVVQQQQATIDRICAKDATLCKEI